MAVYVNPAECHVGLRTFCAYIRGERGQGCSASGRPSVNAKGKSRAASAGGGEMAR